MAEEQQCSITSLAESLSRELKCYCEKAPDSFTLLLFQIWESVELTICCFYRDVAKAHVDTNSLLASIYRNRNRVIEDGDRFKLAQFSPISALDEARYFFGWRDDEYCSALAHMAYLCGKLALRHHSRKNFFKAAMYADEAMQCSNALSYFLPIEEVDRRVVIKLRSEQARLRASAPRKKRDKDNARELWKAWQSNLTCYENKARYIADVMEKFQVSLNTARKWFDHFRISTSDAWEVTFGKRYPKKIK